MVGHRTRATAVAVTALLAAMMAPPVAQADDLTWRVEGSPFRLSYVRDGRVLTAQLPGAAGPGARMSYRLADGSTHTLTRLLRSTRSHDGARYTVATDESGRTATVTVRTTARGLRVEWSLDPAGDVTQVFEALTGSTREHFLGAGMHAMYVDLAGQVTPIKTTFVGAGVQSTCNASGSVTPFYLSSAGYGLYADTTSIGRFAFPGARDVPDPPGCQTAPPAPPPPPCPIASGATDRTQVCVKAGRLSYEVYAGNPEQIADAYTAIAGRPALPPKKELALMKWRDTVHGTAEVLEDVDRMQAERIPLGTVWIDNPWEIENAPPDQVSAGTSCIGTLTFDPAMFPDPAGMIDYVHSHGVRFGLWTAPFYRPAVNGKPCPPPDYPAGSFVENPFRTDRLDVDLTNPAAYAHFKRKLTNVFRLGVDMVKGDRGEETNFEPLQLFAGPGVQYQNLYPQLYAKAITEVLRDLHGDDFETLLRAGFSGSPRLLHGCWGADERATFEGLRLALRLGVTSAWSCHPVWGSDTGGYTAADPTVDPTPALFTRWAQFSAVSPVFEVGGQGRNATPWTYDADTVRRFRDAAILHYELFPYLYAQARAASRTGAPILRPLGFQYPHDDEAWAADQELLVGPDLLAAPVTADRAEQDAQAGRPTPVDVYLPAGQWIDLFSGEVVTGGRHVTRSTTLDEFPLYLRAGARIPFNARTPDVWAQPWGLNDLEREGRAGWMYAPQPGERVVIDLRDAPRESQLLVLARKPPRAVWIDGRRVERASSLERDRVGWTFTDGAFGGVVVKLDGPAEVEIDAGR
jgi:alpha-glucosidase (family GH31 glycosyl hydrolase)